jgi:hypothetical protein
MAKKLRRGEVLELAKRIGFEPGIRGPLDLTAELIDEAQQQPDPEAWLRERASKLDPPKSPLSAAPPARAPIAAAPKVKPPDPPAPLPVAPEPAQPATSALQAFRDRCSPPARKPWRPGPVTPEACRVLGEQILQHLAPELPAGRHISNRADCQFTVEQAEVLAALREGLYTSRIRLANGRQVESNAQVLQWVLEQISQAAAAESLGPPAAAC